MITKLEEFKQYFEMYNKETLEPIDPEEFEIDQIVDVLTDYEEIKKIEESIIGSNVSMDLVQSEVKAGQIIYLTALLKPRNKSTAYKMGEMGVIKAKILQTWYGLNKLNQLKKSGKL